MAAEEEEGVLQPLKELADEDPPGYRNWLRMGQNTFNNLVSLVEPSIRSQSRQEKPALSGGFWLAANRQELLVLQ
ncbi:hypothetical protein DPX16_0700 [Anabarilius grahami]|uniref:Uncharacterized protein n=1 Tax=Anabarilius grahami TaxID=495550 RepID=A0A3N0XPU2_ANAGA|nr:hypothetical protein DPX16_0700 [Anabarilius grahami]